MLPGPPLVPIANGVGTDGITLCWGAPAMAETIGVIGYVIFVQVGGMHGFVELISTTGPTCTCQIDGLVPAVWHEFKVAAVTLLGTGAQSGSSLPIQTQSPTTRGETSIISTGISSREGRRYMAREYKRLKRRLKDWEVEFEQTYSRTPTADDRGLNRPIQELHRRAQAVKAQLVVTIKDHMEGAAATRANTGSSYVVGCCATDGATSTSGVVDESTGLLMPTQQEVAAIEMLFHDFDVRTSTSL